MPNPTVSLLAVAATLSAALVTATPAAGQVGGPGNSDFGRGLVQSAVRDFDFHKDGSIDRVDTLTYTWDRKGQLLEQVQRIDGNNDSVVDRVTRRTWTYDQQGRVTVRILAFDGNADGIVDSVDVLTYTYDSRGDLASEHWSFDDDNDGAPDRTESRVYTYNADRSRATLAIDLDDDGDGATDRVWRFTYTHTRDGNLRLLRLFGELDAGLDGTIDSIDDAHYTRNARGDLLSFTDLWDMNEDGTLDFWAIDQTYTPSGRLIVRSETIDWMNDGTIDETTLTRYTYDKRGNLVVIEQDFEDIGAGPDWFSTTRRSY